VGVPLVAALFAALAAVPVVAVAPADHAAGAAAPPYTACPVWPKTSPKPLPAPTVAPSYPGTEPVGGPGLDTAGLTVPAGAPAPPATVSARSWLVADLDTGQVLGACGPHLRSAPASVQKLLLAWTVLPELDPLALVQVTPDDLKFEPGSSAVGLVNGGKYSVATLWLGLFLNSGNDAANMLARLGGGTGGVDATLAGMNAQARRLGALDTHAATPSGLDGPGQETSAYDLALIARACFGRADFRGYVSTKVAYLPAEPPNYPGYQIQNDNQLLWRYPGALGGKTGFTDLARHTFVGFAQRGGRRLVVTVLGAESHPYRGWQQGAALLSWGFSVPPDASVGRLVEPGELDQPVVASAPVAPAAATTGTRVSSLDWLLPGAFAAGLFVVFVWFLVLLGSRRHRRA
jgi:serine-type D-Ala-D-Ala carboxypeptidase (penicillin-binding protein 5/6)